MSQQGQIPTIRGIEVYGIFHASPDIKAIYDQHMKGSPVLDVWTVQSLLSDPSLQKHRYIRIDSVPYFKKMPDGKGGTIETHVAGWIDPRIYTNQYYSELQLKGRAPVITKENAAEYVGTRYLRAEFMVNMFSPVTGKRTSPQGETEVATELHHVLAGIGNNAYIIYKKPCCGNFSVAAFKGYKGEGGKPGLSTQIKDSATTLANGHGGFLKGKIIPASGEHPELLEELRHNYSHLKKGDAACTHAPTVDLKAYPKNEM